MPVPVVVTHANGVGVAAASNTALATEVPFERAKRLSKQRLKQEKQQLPQQQAQAGVPAQQMVDATPVAHSQQIASSSSQPAIVVQDLEFSYPGLDGRPQPGVPPMITGMTLQLPAGSRCLLLGANGAGKTTLLKVLGGKHMIPESSVRVLGRPPFHDTPLTITGDLSYIGGSWVRDVAFAGYSIPLAGDFPAQRMIDAVPGADEERKKRLIKVLDIDPQWRMHQVSDGQRRRVQICVGLLKKFKVLLLDEVTVDLDVLGRADLMTFLKDECEQRGACIVYATHIFDGLESWPTHVAYIARGKLQMFKPANEVPELQQGKLLLLAHRLLSEERDRVIKERGPRPTDWDPSREGLVDSEFSYAFNNGWVPGTLTSSLKQATNAVMRN